MSIQHEAKRAVGAAASFACAAALACFAGDGDGVARVLREPLPDKVVVLTFDDAVRSQYTFVAPILKEYGFGATFYVCEFPASAKEKEQYLNWDEIAALNKMGFEIANHTRTHPHIGKIPDEKVLAELNYIDEQCAAHGVPKTTTFAYPGYGVNEKALPWFEQRGFTFARAGGNRCYDPASDHPYLVPSFDVAGTNEVKVINYLKQVAPGKIAVLTIHGVPDLIHPWVDMPQELFKRYMAFLKENGYTVIAMRDLTRFVDTAQALSAMDAQWRQRFAGP